MEQHATHGQSLNRITAVATLHCLSGCAVGEVLGLAIGTAAGLGTPMTIALAVGLAFMFGYAFTMVPLIRAGMTFSIALPIAFAADSFSIAVMELVDNGVMLAVPGAMDEGLASSLFWGALAFALVVAFIVAFPVNRHLIARGRGHAVVHAGAGDEPAIVEEIPGTRWKLIALGLVAVVLTMGIATTGAILVDSHRESGGDDPPVMPHAPAGHASR